MSDSKQPDTDQKTDAGVIDESSDQEKIRIRLTVPNHDTLVKMMSLLNEEEIPVQTEGLSRASTDGPESVLVDLGELTDKQREALTTALDTGYYEQPRQIDLGGLAETMDISKSAVSQRLRTAEAKLVRNAFGKPG